MQFLYRDSQLLSFGFHEFQFRVPFFHRFLLRAKEWFLKSNNGDSGDPNAIPVLCGMFETSHQ
jgi:hypothetical protein